MLFPGGGVGGNIATFSHYISFPGGGVGDAGGRDRGAHTGGDHGRDGYHQ